MSLHIAREREGAAAERGGHRGRWAIGFYNLPVLVPLIMSEALHTFSDMKGLAGAWWQLHPLPK